MADVKTLQGNVIITPKQFTQDNGDVIDYYDISLSIDGQVIKLGVKSDYKKLFEFLVSNKLK